MRAALAFLSVLVNVLALATAEVWDIWVFTGDVYDAGTDSNVYISLHGSRRSSSFILLDNKYDNHERDGVDYYPRIHTPYLGSLRRIFVWHDDSGSGWYLDRIDVRRRWTRKEYVFGCYCWLDSDIRRLGRSLYPSSIYSY